MDPQHVCTDGGGAAGRGVGHRARTYAWPDEWSLVGAVDAAAPSWLGQVALPIFRWDATRDFVPAATPEAGKGYWGKKL